MRKKAIQEPNNDSSNSNVLKTSEIMTFKAPRDIQLRKGSNVIDTNILVDDGEQYIVTGTEDNAINGLLVEKQMRLPNSSIVPLLYSEGTVKIVINVNDEVLITEHASFSVRTRNCRIEHGTEIAQIMRL